jgi:hypothetical protein
MSRLPPAPSHTGARPVARASLSDRRNTLRGPVQTKARLTVLDGVAAGRTHEILTRDMSLAGIAFLLRENLEIGQQCRLDFETGPTRQAQVEVVRSRPISNGRYEVAVQFRKQI